ncbi:DUF3977 family protein [Solibacillus sp. FSL K6-1126]
MYIRIWIKQNVLIVDLKEGIKLKKKDRNEFKFIFGITSST